MMNAQVVFVVFVVALFSSSGIVGQTIPREEASRLLDNPLVEIADGAIVGTSHVTDKETRYVAFRGIPYAEPPVADLRFTAPVKNANWTGSWDATADASICIQGSGDTVRGSEDCLYINVYAPEKAENLAVLVWIYGGAFTGGDSTYDSYAPDFFLDDNVVFVSFNYRLGVFGFLSTEDKLASGNWALKDQVLALKWVKDNIAAFGGDVNRITIFGESAGGASVSYLVQIPQAEGLFNAAIIQSGNSENLWALSTRARQAAFQVGSNLGIVALRSSTLLKGLRKADAYKLQTAASSALTKIAASNPLRGLPFAPVIEVESDGAVFTKSSDDYLKSGQYPSKVPIMIGHTSNESGHAHGLPELLRNYLFLFNVAESYLAPYSLTTSAIYKSLAAKRIRLTYFGLASLTKKFYEVVNFVNIDQFTRGIRRFAENVSPYVPVYFYVFGYMGQIVGENPYDGAGHAEELFYLFKQPGEYSEKDLVVKDKLVRLWTNFAKEFNPTPSEDSLLDGVIWPQLNSTTSDLEYVWLNSTLSKALNPDEKEYRFYEDIFKNYGGSSFTTY
nr:carboxylesterase COEA10 [Dendroctonus rhizophagus]